MWFRKKGTENEENDKKFGGEYPGRASEDSGNQGNSMKRVYAGPPMRKKKLEEMRCVYAGPPIQPQRPTKDEIPMAPLYGGPVYNGRIQNRNNPMNGVYAGPNVPPVPMTLAYAGPGLIGPDNPGFAFTEQKICKACGTANPKKAKFCMECGEKYEVQEGPISPMSDEMNQCSCGAMVRVGQKFCPECGAAMYRKV